MARKIVDGKAVVSAKELEASGLSLRNFLNKEQGLTRKPPEGTKFGVSGPRNPSVKDDTQIVKREGATPSKEEKEEAPKPRARSLVDQGRGVNIYENVDRDAVLNAGLGLASVFPGTAVTRAAYGAARPAIETAAKYLSKPTGLRIKKPNFSGTKDSPAASVADDIKDPSFNPDKMVDRNRAEHTFNPEKMVDRRSTTFPGRTEQNFNPEKMTGRDQPEPNFKKGGKVSGASKRGDGIAQRGKTKGRMC